MIRVVTIRRSTIAQQLAVARDNRRLMQKDNYQMNSQYYSGKIAVLQELLNLPTGEIEE